MAVTYRVLVLAGQSEGERALEKLQILNDNWITGDGNAILILYWDLKLLQGMSSLYLSTALATEVEERLLQRVPRSLFLTSSSIV